MELLGNVKTYEWGKLGATSKVAVLAAISDKNFIIQENTSYSELWMGDHVSGPSLLKSTGEPLSEFISKNPTTIGNMQSLPFLLKVLSIRKALSLQVHPNKTEAERLHAQFPTIYKDPNHKPELAIALTPFTALCGFRTFQDIAQTFHTYPEIANLVGKDTANTFTASPTPENLRHCFEAVMRADQNSLIKTIAALKHKFTEAPIRTNYEEIFLRLDGEFPNDVGSIALFFLNLVHLESGEAVNLEANLPHAYLEGDCIECMACSDNVVRAGLTPKFKDVDTLVNMLEYDGKTLEEVVYKPKLIDGQPYTRAFIPKVKDFAVLELKVPQGVDSYQVANRKFGSILLVLEGQALLNIKDNQQIALSPGAIIFLPATTASLLPLAIGDKGGFVAYQAMFNDF